MKHSLKGRQIENWMECTELYDFILQGIYASVDIMQTRNALSDNKPDATCGISLPKWAFIE